MSVVLKNVGKKYKNNDSFVFQELSLTIEAGSVYCLLGKNGAGKSTLLNILTDVIQPSAGEVLIDGLSYTQYPIRIKRQTGVQSQFDQLIGELNAKDFLMWTGLLYGMDKDQIAIQSEHLLDFFFDNEGDLSAPSKSYSSGMQKKLVLCSAIMHKPRFLILDEPFASLDPVACDKLCQFINAYRSPDRVMIVSSHDLLYVDKIASHIGILHNGSLVFNDTLASFKKDNLDIDTELIKLLSPPLDNSSLIELVV
ncbi:MAG TPA: ABC transporter ATP-binding protein [Puia sp.]|nr:ABC transporter ATP-binding protein [Puia sp.]